MRVSASDSRKLFRAIAEIPKVFIIDQRVDVLLHDVYEPSTQL